ncbi:MAG TPA: branched-chain amino acid transport system II carrier protein [Rhabdochlamydiaceae bacterium]
MSTKPQSLPAEKIRQSSLFTTGLALFSMFFGAGNLIFPLLIGKSVGSNVWFAIFGLGLTAVIVPFLGLAAMVLFQADYHRFFGRLGKVPGMMLLLVLQLILGPFGVIPRLVTLMHATVRPYLFDMPLMLFSIFAAVLIFGCSFKRQRLIGFLGAILTPILLLSLMALVFFGLTSDSTMSPVSPAAGDSFLQGLVGGYNMMDLIAAFLFASVVLPHFQKETELEHPAQRRRSLMKKMVLSSLIAAALLFLTYVGLCLISAHHGGSIDPAHPQEQMLSTIAAKLLGPAGGCIAAIAVVMACLTTAMTLVSIFADYLQKDLCKEKISPTLALVITLAITTLFANLGFGGIAAFLGPIVQIVYPGLILLTLLNILHSLYGYRLVKWPVFLTFAASAVNYFVQ